MNKKVQKIGLFYALKSDKTARVAEKIRKELGDEPIVEAVETAWQKDFETYDLLIIGASTWFDGELPTYWDELYPELQTLEMKGKKVALFGLGDQVKYPDNFADSLGILADSFEQTGAKIVGFTSTEGYTFSKSKSLRNGQWCGLVLDEDNQPELSNQRIEQWCRRLKELL